jgi:hypothetical protein
MTLKHKAPKLPKGTPAPTLNTAQPSPYWSTPPPPTTPAPSTQRRNATLSKERIRQIEDTAIRKLRHHMRVNGLTLDDLI